MKSFLNRKVVIGATALVLLGGAGGAIAATQLSGRSGAQAYINDVAAHLGVSSTALSAAMKAAATDQINAAVAAGRITQSQASALEQRIQQRNGVPFLGDRLGAGGFGGAAGRNLRGHGLGAGALGGGMAAAKYLGITVTALRGDLQAGKSVADVASTTSGKSVAGLEAAILASEKTRLDSAVSSGRITSQQEQERLSKLSSRIDALVTRTWRPGSGGARGWFGHRVGHPTP